MYPLHFSRLVALLLLAVLVTGCGGSSAKDEDARTIEKHVLAAEQLGVMLADVQTKADLERNIAPLRKQAEVLAGTVVAMDKAVLDNASLGEAEKMAAIAPYQMRLAEAERLWRVEAQRVAALDAGAIDELREIIAKAR